MQDLPPGFERPAHVPPPRMPVATHARPASGATAQRLQRWRDPLFAGFVTFLIGNALGLIAAGLMAPADFAVATQMPDRPSVMDLWVRYGTPAVALLAALATFLRLRRGAAGEGFGAALLASSLPFAVAVALVYLLYPGSRSAQLDRERSNYALLDARETALSASPATLERTLAEYRDTPYEKEVAQLVERSGMLTGPQPLPPGAIAEARVLVQRGLLPGCPQCGEALRAKELWNELGPGLLPWAIGRCEGRACVPTLLSMLLDPPHAARPDCAPLPGGRALSISDVDALQALLDARPDTLDPPQAARLDAWLGRQRAQCGAGRL